LSTVSAVALSARLLFIYFAIAKCTFGSHEIVASNAFCTNKCTFIKYYIIVGNAFYTYKTIALFAKLFVFPITIARGTHTFKYIVIDFAFCTIDTITVYTRFVVITVTKCADIAIIIKIDVIALKTSI